MNKKIKKYLDEIAKTEKKIADLQQYLRGVQAALKQEEDNEMIKCIRGMKMENGQLYEGTGLEGKSKLLNVDLATGKINKAVDLGAEYFGEGICILKDKIYQLTWQNRKVFVYDKSTFNLLQTFSIETEGWGICTDGQNLIVSDGTNKLSFYDPEKFQLIKELFIKEKNANIYHLNELEFVDGSVYANKWNSDLVYRIDPVSGKVTGKLNLSALTKKAQAAHPEADVLNGIAFNSQSGNFYVTGKRWLTLFEVKLD